MSALDSIISEVTSCSQERKQEEGRRNRSKNSYDHRYAAEEILEFVQMIPTLLYSEILFYLSCISCYECNHRDVHHQYSYDVGLANSEEDDGELVETSDDEDDGELVETSEDEDDFSERNLSVCSGSGLLLEEDHEASTTTSSNISNTPSSKFHSRVIQDLRIEELRRSCSSSREEKISDSNESGLNSMLVLESGDRSDNYALPSIKSKNGDEENYEEMFNSDALYSSYHDSLSDIDGDSLLSSVCDENNNITINSKLGGGSVQEHESNTNNNNNNNNKVCTDLPNLDSGKNLMKSSSSITQGVISNDTTVLDEYRNKDDSLVDSSKIASASVDNDHLIDEDDALLVEDVVLPCSSDYDAQYDLLNTITSRESWNNSFNYLFSNSNLGGGSDVELEDNEEDLKKILNEIQDKLQLTKNCIDKVRISSPQIVQSDDDFFNSSIFANGSMLEISKAVQSAKQHGISSSEAISQRLNNAMNSIATIIEDSGGNDEGSSSNYTNKSNAIEDNYNS